MINFEKCGLYWIGTTKAEAAQIMSKFGCRLGALAGMSDEHYVYGEDRYPIGTLVFDNYGTLSRASRILRLNGNDASSLFQILSRTLIKLNCRASTVNLRTRSVNPDTTNQTLTFACGDRFIEVASTVRDDKTGARFDSPSISEIVISTTKHQNHQ